MSVEVLQRLPAGFQMWSPTLQAATLFLSTFVLEDVATVGAGLLLASGVLAWPLAFGACFTGIWLGDAGLYGFARVVGRNWLERTFLKRFSAQVEQSEQWFARRGNWILIFSRLLPGARLPTYLAAGFLRLPLNRFLLITGTASLIWTLLILFLVQALGAKALIWLGPFRNTAWLMLLGLSCAFLGLQVVKRGTTPERLKRLMTWLEKWLHWEFWPAWMFYPPVALNCLWLAIKYRG